MGGGTNINRLVTELFPEATYCASGLDHGKWITQHYKFAFKNSFYTEVESGRTVFVNGREWKKILNGLKELEVKDIS